MRVRATVELVFELRKCRLAPGKAHRRAELKLEAALDQALTNITVGKVTEINIRTLQIYQP